MQLKQLEELEQEQDLLLQGLAMMARGRDWYQQQLKRVQERQRRLGQSKASAVSGPGAARPWRARESLTSTRDSAFPSHFSPGLWDGGKFKPAGAPATQNPGGSTVPGRAAGLSLWPQGEWPPSLHSWAPLSGPEVHAGHHAHLPVTSCRLCPRPCPRGSQPHPPSLAGSSSSSTSNRPS